MKLSERITHIINTTCSFIRRITLKVLISALCVSALCVMVLSGCGNSSSSIQDSDNADSGNTGSTVTSESTPETLNDSSTVQVTPSGDMASGSYDTPEPYMYINSSGDTLEARFNVPEGYTRTSEDKNSLAAFLRNYKLKEDGSPVLLYDGSPKGNQSAHMAVLTLPIENEDLQQCADSIMRIYGEYYYSLKQYDKICYPLGGGFNASFDKWRKGYGITLSSNKLIWTSQAGNDSGYESFRKFMRIVFAYSGTINMSDDSKKISLKKASVGDIFIKGGSPGHVVMIVDMCRDSDGHTAYLLGQGYMPAQEFHILKNPLHEDDPWYYKDEITYPLHTPEYIFEKGSLRHPGIAD